MTSPGTLPAVEQRSVARALAAVRVGVGAALLLTPRLAQRVWLGPGRTAPRLARALGARDVALGAAVMRSSAAGTPTTTWIRAGAAADAVDAAGHVLAGRRLGGGRRALWSAVAGTMAALGWWAGGRAA
jgi:hypothetical protein